jgi:hypothetical protein
MDAVDVLVACAGGAAEKRRWRALRERLAVVGVSAVGCAGCPILRIDAAGDRLELAWTLATRQTREEGATAAVEDAETEVAQVEVVEAKGAVALCDELRGRLGRLSCHKRNVPQVELVVAAAAADARLFTSNACLLRRLRDCAGGEGGRAAATLRGGRIA